MTLFSLLKKEDYLMIKWQIVFAVIATLVAIGIYFGIDYFDTRSLRNLRIAQSDFDNARSRVELIEEEEATIIEYIGRYQMLNADGVVQEEDRLQMLERVADIRAENNLFPVSLNISEQTSLRLNYPQGLREPGEPIALRSSIIGLDLPLLHEVDLLRLLDGILDSPGLFQTRSCSISQTNTDLTTFLILSQHFEANCEILWYTFDLDPPVENNFGF